MNMDEKIDKCLRVLRTVRPEEEQEISLSSETPSKIRELLFDMMYSDEITIRTADLFAFTEYVINLRERKPDITLH